MEEIQELKQMMIELTNKVNMLLSSVPKYVSLSDVANELDISRQTLTYFVKSNYKPEVDFYKKNNKIYLDVSILCSLRGHYAK